MCRKIGAGLALLMLTVLAACGDSPVTNDAQSPSEAGPHTTAGSAGQLLADPQAPSGAGPPLEPGGGLVAESSGVEGMLAISIKWSAEVITGVEDELQTTTVYNRLAEFECPITSSDEASYSYFAVMDDPDNSDPFAPTGSYQPWWNEECAGSLTIDDTYHLNDPTIPGPEPVVSTTGTQVFETSSTPVTVETDLNRARTRYLFISPSAEGFQQHAAEGYEAKLVAASAAPMATMDFTLEGPVGDGKQEVAVEGGRHWVDWTFTRESNPR